MVVRLRFFVQLSFFFYFLSVERLCRTRCSCLKFATSIGHSLVSSSMLLHVHKDATIIGVTQTQEQINTGCYSLCFAY